MTEQISNPRAGIPVSASAPAENAASVENGILDCLLREARATRMAIEVAKTVPYTARSERATAAEMFDYWRASNLIVSKAFDALDRQLDFSEGILRSLIPRR